MAVVYENDLIQVIHQPGVSDYTLVTFGSLLMRADGANFWGKSLADKHGLDCLGIMPKASHWYPIQAMRGAEAALVPLLKPEVIVYGDSMGAFGALKYSAMLRANHIIALRPQGTINPSLYPDNGFSHYYIEQLHNDMEIKTDDMHGVCWLFYDGSYNRDVKHLEFLPANAQYHYVSVPFVQHETPLVIAEGRIFLPLLDAVMDSDMQKVRAIIRTAKRRSVTYQVLAAQVAVRQRRFDVAAHFVERAAQLGLPGPQADAERAFILSARGMIQEAVSAAKRAVANGIADYRICIRLAELIGLHGDVQGSNDALFRAADLATAEVVKNLKSISRWYEIVSIYRMLGKTELVLSTLQEAVDHNPDNPVLLTDTGFCLLPNSNYISAEDHFRRATTLKPDFARAYIGLARAFAAQGARQKEVDITDLGIRCCPCDHQLLSLRGWQHVDAQRLDDALAAFQAAVAINARDVSAHHGLCSIHEQRGDLDAARIATVAAYAAVPDANVIAARMAKYQSELSAISAA